MIRPRRYFPWKIVGHYAFRFALFYGAVLVVAGFSIRYYAIKTFLGSPDVVAALGEFDEYLSGLGAVLAVAGAAFAAWSARLYFEPMGRVVQRARELRRSRAVAPVLAADDYASEEPGEWADLERALERIRSDLRAKADQLSREREELAALLAGVSDAILAVDAQETPLFFNPQFTLLFGVKAARPSQSMKLAEILRTPDVLDAFREVLVSGAARTVAFAARTARYPAPRHFSLSVAPLRDKDTDRTYGAVGIFHDVTELKQAEQIRIEFVGNASHELRTPLTSIKGYVETLKDDVKAGRADALGPFLDIVAKNVDRLILLVNDLLDLSAIESGAELRKSAVGTREVTESVLRQLEGKRASKSIGIRVDIRAESLSADPRRVEQVLMNLVHNAIKYIPEGGAIEIRWREEGGDTFLSVKDNGPGIPLEHQGRLFERFYRVDAGRSREQGGTGLGLSIVKHIMLKHGGGVQLHSRLEEGAEFVCRFPGAGPADPEIRP